MFKDELFNEYTVESVTSGHPDKICDQISDAILDAHLSQDPDARVAVEAFGSHGLLVIGGEVTSNAKINYKNIAENIYKEIGYSNPLEIITRVSEQSHEIGQGVDTGGAGDQGIMYGFATDETKEMIPKGVVIAHALSKRLEEARRNGEIKWLRPDGKTQVTISYGKVKTILISTQHEPGITNEEIYSLVLEKIIKPIVGEIGDIRIIINPSGAFTLGGFEADAGLTGRKIMVDSYGGLVPHGGGCFSGKDATKVDRSGAYMARFVAKNLVSNGYAKKALVSVSYAIGFPDPVMIEGVDENGKSLKETIMKNFDFRPKAIIKTLNLQDPIYQKTATYGHFGKKDLPWEKIVKI
jgi:S-adenosylmethionine synthetase